MAEEKVEYELLIIGGSAGSVEVLLQLIPKFPADFGMAIIVVIHRKAMDEDVLLGILQKRSKMSIKSAEGNELIKSGVVYLAPADYHLLVEDDKSIVLDYSEKVHYSRPSIDLAFQSAAEVYENKAIGVILTGANEDGALGIQCIQKMGGCTVVQSLESALMKTMPEAADRLITADHVLNIKDITDLLIQMDKMNASHKNKK